MTSLLGYLFGISLTQWFILWFPSLLVISSCAWILSDAAAGSMKDAWPSGLDTMEFQPSTQMIQINIPEVQALGKRTVWIKTLAVILGIGISGAVGYGIRDYQLISNTHTYLDVKVLDKYSPDKYLLQPVRMQPWISKTCEPLDLTPGRTMKFYTYEQMADCHRVKSFEFYANSKGERVDAQNRKSANALR